MGVRFNEDASDVYNFFVGPGVNVAGANSDSSLDLSEMNDYPEGNRMMPVGSYIRSQTDPCVGEFHEHKHIVKMYAIPDWLNQQKGVKRKTEEDEEDREGQKTPCYEDCECNKNCDSEQESGDSETEQQPDRYYCHIEEDSDNNSENEIDEGDPQGVCKKIPVCKSSTLKTLKDSNGTIYVFDVQNAHDGLCGCVEEPF